MIEMWTASFSLTLQFIIYFSLHELRCTLMPWQSFRNAASPQTGEAVACCFSMQRQTRQFLSSRGRITRKYYICSSVERRQTYSRVVAEPGLRGVWHVLYQQQQHQQHQHVMRCTRTSEMGDGDMDAEKSGSTLHGEEHINDKDTNHESSSPASTGTRNQKSSASGINNTASVLGMTAGRAMSLKQRQRAFQIYVHTWMLRIIQEVPVFKALVDWLKATVISPYMIYSSRFNEWKETCIADYEQYLAEETKERWSWEKRHRKEMALLQSIPPYIGMVLATLLYQTFVPLSVSCAILAPLYCSWILYDRWWTSPILLGMILISPWKFMVPPGTATWSYIWPTLL